MKTCTKCGILKPLEDYYGQSDRKNGASSCKSCFNRMCVERWVNVKKKAIKYKGGSCVSCGYCKHYSALHFHHTDPLTKEFNWNKLRVKAWSKITKELDKCLLLCANCHAEEHWAHQ